MRQLYRLIILCGFMLAAQFVVAQKITVGQYTFKDGSIYNGQLTNGKPNGRGKTVFLTGDTYEGEYLKAKRHGEGTYSFVDGEKYEGSWVSASGKSFLTLKKQVEEIVQKNYDAIKDGGGEQQSCSAPSSTTKKNETEVSQAISIRKLSDELWVNWKTGWLTVDYETAIASFDKACNHYQIN